MYKAVLTITQHTLTEMFPLLVAMDLIVIVVILNNGRLIILTWEILGELWGHTSKQTVPFDLIVFHSCRKFLEEDWSGQNCLKREGYLTLTWEATVPLQGEKFRDISKWKIGKSEPKHLAWVLTGYVEVKHLQWVTRNGKFQRCNKQEISRE